MLIRSQNKAVLLNFSNLAAIYTVKDGDDFIISSLEGENKCMSKMVQVHSWLEDIPQKQKP